MYSYRELLFSYLKFFFLCEEMGKSWGGGGKSGDDKVNVV